MSRRPPLDRGDSPPPSARGLPRCQAVFLFLLAAGIALNALLFYWKLRSSAIAGCGGSACDEVLASRWSTAFGVPVSLLAMGVYGILLFSWFTRKPTVFAAGLTMLGGSVLWFAFLQFKVLGAFCPWCLAAHGTAVATMIAGSILMPNLQPIPRRGVMVGVVAAMVLVAAQVFGPVPASHRFGESSGSIGVQAGDVHSRGSGRKIAFDDGAKTYDVSSLPRWGPADARHVLVEYFDYQCPACRSMHGFLAALREKHPRDVAVILLPVPLERECNRMLGPKDTIHPGSCERSRIALAVWRAEPAAFEEIHRAFLGEITPEKAMGMALAKIPPERLEMAMRDPWIDEVLAVNAGDWIVFSNPSRTLPKLLITGRRILHGLPSGEEEFIRAMERELGL